jgi:hypothetical protein
MKHNGHWILVVLFLALAGAGCQCGKGVAAKTEIELFNGRDLAGWKHVLADPACPPEKVWSVKDGSIVCLGEPLGYLYSHREFTSFLLSLEYRWAPGKKPGNSGVFSRVNGSPRALPRCVEVQLMHGNAGDVLGLQGMKLASDQPRYFHVAKHELAGDIDGVKKLTDHEKPPGEWNEVRIEASGSHYAVWLNGQKVNEANGVELQSGPIGLQSEGGEIHFRRIRVTAAAP